MESVILLTKGGSEMYFAIRALEEDQTIRRDGVVSGAWGKRAHFRCRTLSFCRLRGLFGILNESKDPKCSGRDTCNN